MYPEISSDIENRLRSELEGEVRFSKIDRILYSTDASNFQIIPLGVVIPRTTEDVVKTVKAARDFGVSVLPRGGGTGLAGQSLGYGIVVDFSKYLNEIESVDAEAKSVRVQPGIYLETLNNSLRQYNLCFGPDPSTARVATVGGVVGNNGTGSHSILYGMAGDHINSADVVLHDGSYTRLSETSEDISRYHSNNLDEKLYNLRNESSGIISSKFPRHWRIASGYSLNYLLEENFNPAKLLASSEGTLAIATGFELNLVDLPERKGLAILQFKTIPEAVETVPDIVKKDPSAVELIDGMLVELTREHKGYSHLLKFVRGNPGAMLIVEFYGGNERELDLRLDEFSVFVKQKGWNCSIDMASDPHDQSLVWQLRKSGLGLLMSRRSEFKPIPCIEDVSVPVENLPDYVEDILDILGKLGLKAGFYGHASAGCLHIRPLLNLKTPMGKKQMRELEHGALQLALKYGGVMSGEHGDGLQRSYLNETLFGPEIYSLMKQLKNIFDPDNIFNPGKVVNSSGYSDDEMRYSEKLIKPQLNTHLDWTGENGLLSASEMCNGQGICRKTNDGIMCPSYMATKDEKDTTRARANTLRAIASGRLSFDSLYSRDVYDVFDLCISCKACGNECPSSVDVAKMKSEYLAQYKYKKGFSLRDRLFGYIHDISRYASFSPSVSNYLSGTYLSSKAMEYIGIERTRSMPAYAEEPFSKWFRSRDADRRHPQGRSVVYFHDTWTEYFYPDIGKAAVELLEKLGFDVRIEYQRHCCGRPMISKGMLREARKKAKGNVDLFARYAREGIPIIGTEASCVSAFKDDYLSLYPSDDTSVVADHVQMIDEFLADSISLGNVQPEFSAPQGTVLYHGHCHQRSLSGISATTHLLRSCGFDIQESNSTCCGMAGSFGYEAEHYEVSGKIGEYNLFPAVRKISDDDMVCVSGVSCLEQIEHFTGRKPLHIAQLLNKCLNSGN